jgi:hypothetical protein
MIRLFVLLGILVLILSCNNSSRELLVNGTNYKIFHPPGTKEIELNIYVDESELSNIGYKEYLFWLERTFGNESKEYTEAQPDITVWKQASEELQKHMKSYFDDMEYISYPVVGINLSQGEKYTIWRTERVAEMILIMRGYIEVSPSQNRETHFTIEKYMSGKYQWTKKQAKKMLFPIYKIPTQTEWEKYILNDVAEQIKSDKEFKGNSKLIRKGFDLYNLKNKNKSKGIEGPKSRNGYGQTSKGLTHIIGNVSEMVISENKSMGGNWTMDLEDISKYQGEKFEQANYYTGLRNICTWEEKVFVSE